MQYCRKRNLPPNATVTQRQSISAKSGQVTLIWSRKLFPTVKARLRPWMARPKRSNSVECKIGNRQRKRFKRFFGADRQSSCCALRRDGVGGVFRLSGALRCYYATSARALFDT